MYSVTETEANLCNTSRQLCESESRLWRANIFLHLQSISKLYFFTCSASVYFVRIRHGQELAQDIRLLYSRISFNFLLSALLCRVMGSALSWLSPSSTGAVAKLYTVSTPVRLKVKNVDKLGAEDEVSLSSFLQTRCPSLFSPYTPAWWLNR